MFRVCVMLFAVMCAEAGVSVGKAFFCRDPDTGKLHPANTTWPSTTFCGNYHCRLRKKNITQTDYPPIRQFNITNMELQNEIPKHEEILTKVGKKLNLKKNAIDIIGINNLDKTEISNLTREDTTSEGSPKAAEDDRYLTEKEIATISAILHSVKKSDLDAIIEIYNLAQDIYKEVDKTNPENLIHETVNDIKKDLFGIKMHPSVKSNNEQQVSYWYEPISSGKTRVFNTEMPDMTTLMSNPIKVTTPKPAAPVTIPTVPATKSFNSYFDKTLTSKDFGKLPYYYPISSFQRSSTYVHKPIEQKVTQVNPIKSPEPHPTMEPSKYRKNIKPSIYLPYPFSFIPRYYNWSYPHTIYYNKNYLEREQPKKEKNKTPIKNAVLINPDLENDQVLFKATDIKTERGKEDERLVKLSPEKKDEKFKHDWQTAPISKHILDDARAHMDKTKFLRPFTLRKKVKLERVGKLFKLDELNKRSKRESTELEPELYEVYIERTTCKADETVPGFFRYGNISQPYPDCCPQRIL